MSVLVASLVAVAGLWYSGVQTQQANDHARQASDQARQERALTKEGQITDRYTAAVSNLGEDKMDVRLGGIYALQRIMQDSPRDHPTIANVLATYVRTHAAEPPEKGQAVPADVHAALTVLTTRNTAQDGAFRLDLRSVWLSDIEIGRPLNEDPASLAKANLSHANLRGTDLFNSDMREADLRGADLREADLTFAQMHRTGLQGADLRGAELFAADLRDAGLAEANLAGVFLRAADLPGASLPGADLSDSNLEGTDLTDADLEGANLTGANLKGAKLNKAQPNDENVWLVGTKLKGADLSGVKNLTRKQLDSARIDGKTKFPAGLS
ncbi:pentapeptide repeat-containing protein [Streptomyces sp. NBC_01725]|uniref:pentapeptide repeat-containing protein n=1 Tax=Streptomyces sp. NBC_01725 TaxID=2975923 RepID=UPI002E29197F|nr:pentapeptide repeat-containing protein [Streptomyces sp. NBC_01725]